MTEPIILDVSHLDHQSAVAQIISAVKPYVNSPTANAKFDTIERNLFKVDDEEVLNEDARDALVAIAEIVFDNGWALEDDGDGIFKLSEIDAPADVLAIDGRVLINDEGVTVMQVRAKGFLPNAAIEFGVLINDDAFEYLNGLGWFSLGGVEYTDDESFEHRQAINDIRSYYYSLAENPDARDFVTMVEV